MAGLHSLTDDTLLSELGAATAEDHRLDTTLLRLIDEIDKRRLWAEQGYPSMFALSVERFRMSESRAGKRIGVARLARRFPQIFELIESGELHLSGALALKPHLTEGNYERVLAAARGKTSREIDLLIAELWPRDGLPTRVRALPRTVQRSTPPSLTLTALSSETQDPRDAGPTPSAHDDVTTHAKSTPAAAQKRPRADDPEPLSPRQFRLSITIDEETHRELGQLQDLLAHQVPNGDPAIIVARALSAFLAQTLKKKAALTDRPRQLAATTEKRTRNVPAAVRREVWLRDEARCAFVAADGRRCSATRKLELAHLEPWAKGGDNSAANITLRCRDHNDYEAVRDYGEAFMEDKRDGRGRASEVVARYLRSPARDLRDVCEVRRRSRSEDAPPSRPEVTAHRPADGGGHSTRQRSHESRQCALDSAVIARAASGTALAGSLLRSDGFVSFLRLGAHASCRARVVRNAGGRPVDLRPRGRARRGVCGSLSDERARLRSG